MFTVFFGIFLFSANAIAACTCTDGVAEAGCYYVATGPSAGCYSCPPGRYCIEGSITENGSGPCNPGRYCSGSSTTAEGEGACASGYWCPSGSKNNHGDTGSGDNECPAPYINGSSGEHTLISATGGARTQNDCFLITSSARYVASAGAEQTVCEEDGYYCPGGTRVYKGGNHASGGRSNCPTEYPKSVIGASRKSHCYTSCSAGKYWDSTEKCIICTNSNALGKYCPGIEKIYWETKYEMGKSSCTGLPDGASWSGTGGSTDNCPWGATCTASMYWNGTSKQCEECPNGYFCAGGGASNDTNGNSGIIPCPAGMTNDGGQSAEQSCYYKGGSTGTKFCDKDNNCFHLPNNVKY